MSQHNSLQGAKGIVIKRNVLKRFERVAILKKRGQWKEGERIMGMRKTKPDVLSTRFCSGAHASPLPAVQPLMAGLPFLCPRKARV
jgi:hypothetical protein